MLVNYTLLQLLPTLLSVYQHCEIQFTDSNSATSTATDNQLLAKYVSTYTAITTAVNILSRLYRKIQATHLVDNSAFASVTTRYI